MIIFKLAGHILISTTDLLDPNLYLQYCFRLAGGAQSLNSGLTNLGSCLATKDSVRKGRHWLPDPFVGDNLKCLLIDLGKVEDFHPKFKVALYFKPFQDQKVAFR